jgi:hypothetical protein
MCHRTARRLALLPELRRAAGRAPAAAREIFARLGAKPAISETDALLAAASG